jgi:hypothetical protein
MYETAKFYKQIVTDDGEQARHSTTGTSFECRQYSPKRAELGAEHRDTKTTVTIASLDSALKNLKATDTIEYQGKEYDIAFIESKPSAVNRMHTIYIIGLK